MGKPIIPLRAAVKALGLRYAGADSDLIDIDASQANMLCPNCAKDHESQRETLNLNFEEDVFSCKRCGFSGGVHQFITYYTGWESKDIAKNIRAGKLSGVNLDAAGNAQSDEAPKTSTTIAPIERRHQVYTAMLKNLELLPGHRDDLRRRGLSDEAIERIGFRSLSKYLDRNALPKKLITDGYDLRGIPGFGLENAKWALAGQKDSGYLIPLRNGSGMIQGFQIRYDHPSASNGKYGYFSSQQKGLDDGVKSAVWSAWAGDDVSKSKEPFDIIITEGPLKGYIVHERTGANVLAVPGVNSLSKLGPALKSFKGFGLRTVYIAYDMDLFDNQDVAKALCGLIEMIKELALPFKIMVWGDEQKGLDDWVVATGVLK